MVIMRVLIDSENGEPMWLDEVMEITEEVLKELVEREEFKQLSKEEQAEILKEFGLE
jgi:hypothetical protein